MNHTAATNDEDAEQKDEKDIDLDDLTAQAAIPYRQAAGEYLAAWQSEVDRVPEGNNKGTAIATTDSALAQFCPSPCPWTVFRVHYGRHTTCHCGGWKRRLK